MSLPEQVVETLNRYYSRMVDIIMKHAGTINSFIGDAILAIFGAPTDPGNEATRAVACAVEMQLAMAVVNSENRERGLPTLAMGIGLNTGEVVIGNIGSTKYMNYTVIGDTVNRVARIESNTVGGQILASSTTLQDVRHHLGDVVRIDGRLRTRAKGISDAITIYDVGGIGGGYNLYLPEPDDPFDGLGT